MEEKEFNYINVIPLVDIMLVLLTIVLVTATFIVQGSIPVNLPQAKHSETSTFKSYQLTITKQGELFFEGRKISLEDLEEIAKTLREDPQITIFSDKEAKVQSLIEVLDILKKNDIKKVAIRTEIIR